jgi:hypothetical protein
MLSRIPGISSVSVLHIAVCTRAYNYAVSMLDQHVIRHERNSSGDYVGVRVVTVTLVTLLPGLIKL